jgi:hypothetical protein
VTQKVPDVRVETLMNLYYVIHPENEDNSDHGDLDSSWGKHKHPFFEAGHLKHE